MRSRHSPSAAGPAVRVARSSERGLQTHNTGDLHSAELGARGGAQSPGSAGGRKSPRVSLTQPLPQPLTCWLAMGVNLPESQFLHLEPGVNDSFWEGGDVSKALLPLTHSKYSGGGSYSYLE